MVLASEKIFAHESWSGHSLTNQSCFAGPENGFGFRENIYTLLSATFVHK